MGNWEHPGHLSDEAKAFTLASRRAEIAVFCEMVLPRLRGVARSIGYALTEHGSKSRDLDLVAIPWTHKAKPAEDLIDAISQTCHALTGWGYKANDGKIVQKPHGRIATTILATAEIHLDLSIMPRQIEADEASDADA